MGDVPHDIKDLKKELAPTKFSHVASATNDVGEEDSFMGEFVPPAEGTPAAEALQANAGLKISRLAKGIRKIKGIKHPKVKNVTKGFRRKRNKERFSRNFKGKVIDGVHELYTLTAGMMLGMRCAVGRQSPTAVNSLALGDFSYVEKISFPPKGNNSGPFRTPPHQLAHTFKFKTYAPLVFSRIRDFFGVDSLNYMLSVCGNYNYLEFISNSKSGQFFFYSHDGRYMIKTQTNEENKFMKRILPHYYRYVTENPHTFLVRIYGMHRVKMYHLNRKVHFVIMGSVFDTPEPINTIYDLKGSLVGRSATAHDREVGGVLKDNDLIDDRVKLKLGSKRELFLNQIEKDAIFLSQLNIMDYSLLVGIHYRSSRPAYVPKDVPDTTAPVDPPPALTQAASGSGQQLAHVPHSNTPFRHSSTALGSSPLKARLSGEDYKESEMTASGSHLEYDPNLPPANPSFRPRAKSITGGVTTPEDTSPKRKQIKTARRASSYISGTDPTDMISLENEYSSESAPAIQDNDISAYDIADNSNPSETNGVDYSDNDTDLDEEGDDFDAEAEEEEPDEGDSDVEFDEAVLEKLLQTSGGVPMPIPKRKKSGVSGGSVVQGMLSQESEEEAVPLHKDLSTSMVGLGIRGNEGRAVAVLFNDRQDLTQLSREAEKELATEKRLTFGPGAAMVHPWSSRTDEGINARLQSDLRGDEIYFIGIIDILQQYNASKRMETFFKGFSNDRTQISSVDSVSYARRFVAFLRDNTT